MCGRPVSKQISEGGAVPMEVDGEAYKFKPAQGSTNDSDVGMCGPKASSEEVA